MKRSKRGGGVGGGTRTMSLFLEKNLCHYTAAAGQWFTAAYCSTGPWSPFRLNVEQHHDWDATSIHSPPLQQLWLTAQHTLFNPRKRAPRWKPAFLRRCYRSWWALINKPHWSKISDCRYLHWQTATSCITSWTRVWTQELDRPAQYSVGLCRSCFLKL